MDFSKDGFKPMHKGQTELELQVFAVAVTHA